MKVHAVTIDVLSTSIVQVHTSVVS